MDDTIRSLGSPFGSRTYAVDGKMAGVPPEKRPVDALRRAVPPGKV